MPPRGFIKTANSRIRELTGGQRARLIRKGNEFFNQGNVEQAKRIFLTTGYSDGLVRAGDYYLSRNDPFEALRLYKLAPDPKRAEAILERMAGVLRQWLGEASGDSAHD